MEAEAVLISFCLGVIVGFTGVWLILQRLAKDQ